MFAPSVATMNSTTHRQPRPVLVTLAVILLVIGTTVRFGFTFVNLGGNLSGNPLVYCIFAIIVSIPYLIIFFIFRGMNWARWTFLIVFGLALLALPRSLANLSDHSALDIVVYGVQVLLALIAAVALLSRPSVEWFRRQKKET
jgi:hypothetical protein